MATAFTHPFASGANLCVMPRLMTVYEEWRRDAGALEEKRIECDLRALRQGCEVIVNAKDWREFNSASQTVVSDYLKATASLWQEGFEVAMRHQSAFGETLSNAMRSWQSTGTSGFEKAAAMTPAAMPLWFKSLPMPTALAQPANFKGDGSIQSRKPSHDGDHLAAGTNLRLGVEEGGGGGLRFFADGVMGGHGKYRMIQGAPGAVRSLDADQVTLGRPA